MNSVYTRPSPPITNLGPLQDLIVDAIGMHNYFAYDNILAQCVLYYDPVLSAADEDTLYHIIDNYKQAEVIQYTKYEHEAVKTGGNTIFEGFVITTDAAPDKTTFIDITFPYPVNLLKGRYFDDKAEFVKGDDFAEFIISPATQIGNTTADVAVGDTLIPVSQTVVDNIEAGFYATITDGTNSEYHIVKSVDKTSLKITLVTPLVNAFLSPTLILMEVKMAKNIYLGKTDYLTPLDGGLGTSYVPAGTVIRALLYNKAGGIKKFFFELEIMY